MAPSLTKLVYKPDNQSTDEYTLIINPEAYKKWKNGDTSIPQSDIVDSFEIFHSGQGSQGILGRPSKQQLDTVFGSSKDVDIVEIMLQKGVQQSGEIKTSEAARNTMRGSNLSQSQPMGSR